MLQVLIGGLDVARRDLDGTMVDFAERPFFVVCPMFSAVLVFTDIAGCKPVGSADVVAKGWCGV